MPLKLCVAKNYLIDALYSLISYTSTKNRNTAISINYFLGIILANALHYSKLLICTKLANMQIMHCYNL